jgi:hypothetical protein
VRLAACLALALLALAGCRTAPAALPPAWAPLAAADPRPAERLAALRALAATRHALRATARVSSEGPEGGGFSNQLLLVERPARLRVEVIGLLQQRVLVLATDGARYELYRAEGPETEAGEVYPGVLDEVAGLPLTPEAAARLLLAAPKVPEAPPERSEEEARDGALRIHFADESLEFDAAGRLVALRFHPDGGAVLSAHWSDWRPSAATATPAQAAAAGEFPHRLELELPERGARWRLEYREVELEPALDPALFRLGLGTR